MTFLELCQRLRQEVGATGSGPNNTAGQSGEYARLVSWIRTAWQEIQNDRRWAFDWAKGEVELSADFAIYALPADFDVWEADTLRFSGAPIDVVPWGQLRQVGGDTFTCVAIAPDSTLHLNALPSIDGPLTFEYWRTPQELTSGTDSPRMPARFHMLIVYRAMIQYALYENAQEVLRQAGINERSIFNRLMVSQLPVVSMEGPLA